VSCAIMKVLYKVGKDVTVATRKSIGNNNRNKSEILRRSFFARTQNDIRFIERLDFDLKQIVKKLCVLQ